MTAAATLTLPQPLGSLMADLPRVLQAVAVAGGAALASRWLSPLLAGQLAAAGVARPNYRQRTLPTAVGIAPALAASLAAAAMAALGLARAVPALLAGIAMMAMVAVGLRDDIAADRAHRGLRGHLAALLRGEGLTTGALKALAGAAVGVAVALMRVREHPAPPEDAVPLALPLAAALAVPLGANGANLLDLRPGRAARATAAAAGAVLLAGLATGRGPAVVWLVPMLAALAAYFPGDAQERWMLGDAGANALGAAAGVGAAFGLAPGLLWAWVGVLAGLHLWAETGSISRWLEKGGFRRREGRRAGQPEHPGESPGASGADPGADLEGAGP